MSKMHIQKVMTVTLELTEAEAKGLKCLLAFGTAPGVLEKLGIYQLYCLIEHDKDIKDLTTQFANVADIK